MSEQNDYNITVDKVDSTPPDLEKFPFDARLNATFTIKNKDKNVSLEHGHEIMTFGFFDRSGNEPQLKSSASYTDVRRVYNCMNADAIGNVYLSIAALLFGNAQETTGAIAFSQNFSNGMQLSGVLSNAPLSVQEKVQNAVFDLFNLCSANTVSSSVVLAIIIGVMVGFFLMFACIAKFGHSSEDDNDIPCCGA